VNRCPHCGGEHFGQRFDNCPYVRLLTDPEATDEQRKNAAATLAANHAPEQETRS
jgi:hypothetical protein